MNNRNRTQLLHTYDTKHPFEYPNHLIPQIHLNTIRRFLLQPIRLLIIGVVGGSYRPREYDIDDKKGRQNERQVSSKLGLFESGCEREMSEVRIMRARCVS